jgi:undecaprenyl phosphate N,N'-diacetylbacillosamine 1-phosphate transferase
MKAYLFFKSFFDVLGALLLLLLLSPLFLMITLLLAIANNGQPFFYQTRPGKKERLFKIIKFKSMNDKKGADGTLLPDVERITKVGNFVRKTSLDELPQLLNVVKGDMSFVGPRPLLVSYLPLYSNEQKKRHLVKPGITGWAQINGRNAISWNQKFTYDVWYVNHMGFRLDVIILWKTFLKVVQHEGVSSQTHATMETFTGNNI